VKQFLADKYIPVLEHTPIHSFSVCWGEIKNGGPAEQRVSWWPSALLWTMQNSYVVVYI
jgi:hypothetical protein